LLAVMSKAFEGPARNMSDDSAIHQWPPAAAREWSLTVVDPEHREPAPAAELASLSDRDLVALALDGDPAAFDVIVARHGRSVYRICYRFVHQHEDAADLAQDVFLRAWRGLARFKGDAAFSTWLYRIAVNASLNKVAGRAPCSEPLHDAERFEDRRAEHPGAALDRRERAAAVRRAIQGLPHKQRATLVLRLYHELSHQEIAGILGSSVGTVKANFFHALRRVKRILGSEP
jgi:RNA polymerase sigma-70 factor (ECF subfamily)